MAEQQKTTQQVVYVEKAANKWQPTVKKVGREPKMKDPSKGTLFLSEQKSYLIFFDDGGFIQFANQMYVTDNKEDIERLRTHDLFETDFWEKEFPESVLKKFEKNREYITRSEETFAVPEA
jgi:hypothetical protein